MLEQMLLRGRFVPSEPPKRRGATSSGPEQGLLDVLAQLFDSVPWGKMGLGVVVLFVTALVPWGTGQLLAAMDRQFLHVEVAGPLKVSLPPTWPISRCRWSSGPGWRVRQSGGNGRTGWSWRFGNTSHWPTGTTVN